MYTIVYDSGKNEECSLLWRNQGNSFARARRRNQTQSTNEEIISLDNNRSKILVELLLGLQTIDKVDRHSLEMAEEKGKHRYHLQVEIITIPSSVLIGVIGGSGLYHLDNLTFMSVHIYLFNAWQHIDVLS
jgi:hypothetical protein